MYYFLNRHSCLDMQSLKFGEKTDIVFKCLDDKNINGLVCVCAWSPLG